MEKVMVRYQVKPEKTEENEVLVRAVYKELKEKSPAGFSYATFKLEDGITFVHLAINLTNEKSPLSGLTAFKDFQIGIRDRCDVQPAVSHISEVGSYGFDFSPSV
jgi:translation elongation factor EF-1beta